MVLLVMLSVLSWRVAEVLRPTEDLPDKIFVRPRPGPTGGLDNPAPPPPPLNPPGPDINEIVRRNPWWVNASPGGGNGAGSEEDVILEVLSIQQKASGEYMARIRTSTATKWIPEGKSFESYELREIDPDSKCCEIWSEDHNKTLKRCIQ